MFRIYIEGKEYQVNEASNLLEACLSHGFDLPYFCWHPALGSVGSCRQCAVKQYEDITDHNGRIIMSCMTPVVDGLIISIDDGEAREFRRNIIELLMINHPHDCPVCSEGGHCHLQDMTVMVGHHTRRYRFAKRTYFNQNLGPFILHEMNRCISCYRCVRFYKDYAGGYDLGVYGAHDNLYFGRFQEGRLESEYSGNLIEVCPTGVFTDKTYSQYYTRKWDIHFSPSICAHCSVGCNVILGERYGKLCRVENRYHYNINGYFLCDRGRFGYGYVNDISNRYKKPLLKQKDTWIELNEEEVVRKAANILHDSDKIIGIGSTRASIESNLALRNLVGADNFYFGINRFEHQVLSHVLNILENTDAHIASVKDIEHCDAILLLGEDVTQTSSRIALAIRQAVKGEMSLSEDKEIPIWHMNALLSLGSFKKNHLFITSVDRTKLDDVASWVYYASLYDQARFGFALAHAIDNTAPAVNDIMSSDVMSKVNIVAKILLNARNPLIVSGSNVGNLSIISSVVNIVKSLKNCGRNVSINLTASDANSIGLGMLEGGSLDDVWDLVEKNVKIDSMIILETDLHRHISSEYVDNILSKTKHLIVLDHQKFPFHNQANLIFSSASVPESDGTFVNQEGRAQRFFRVYSPNYYDSSLVILESWRWLCELCSVVFQNDKLKGLTFDDFIDNVTISFPRFSKIRLASPDASFRLKGQKLARAPHRYSGRTAMHAHVNIHEPRVLQDKDSMFTFSMEGNNNFDSICQHVSFVWAPGWNSSHAWNKFYGTNKEDLSFWDSGVRFFRFNSEKNLDWFLDIPEDNLLLSNNDMVMHDSIDLWTVVPYWHIFGSEEMSQRSFFIKKCISKSYVVLSRIDAIRFDLCNTKILKFTSGSQSLSLPLILSDRLSPGCIGLPIGLPGVSFSYLGMYINKIEGIF